jgi:hypothetical protein
LQEKEEIIMDIGNIGNKILNSVEKNATVLAAAAAMISRPMEDGQDFGTALQSLATHFTNLNIPKDSQIGQGGYGALGEAYISITHPDILMRKLFNSNHMYSGMVKVGIVGWVLGELGVLPAKYANLAKKVATGAGIAAIALPGSGEASYSMNKGSGTTSGNRGYGAY